MIPRSTAGIDSASHAKSVGPKLKLIHA